MTGNHWQQLDFYVKVERPYLQINTGHTDRPQLTTSFDQRGEGNCRFMTATSPQFGRP